MKNDNKLRMLVLTAMLAALVCVATLVIRIPTVGGYTNLGDGFVLLSAFLLGPLYGGIAGGLGSALADLIAGYPYYIPGSFIIKGLVAVFAALLMKKVMKEREIPSVPMQLLCVVPAELFMVAGYFAYKALILGKPAGAVTSIPGNLMQGLAGCIVSILLYQLLIKVPAVREHSWKGR